MTTNEVPDQKLLPDINNEMIKQIHGTHAPADGREVEVKSLYLVVQDLLICVIHGIDHPPRVTPQAHIDHAFEDKTLTNMFETLADIIDTISCEISYKCFREDAHATTMELLKMLSSYTWDAKIVLSLSGFALKYGEFGLVAQLFKMNNMAKSIGLLKQVPEILQDNNMLKVQFEQLNTLIKAVMEVIKCILEFNELPSNYITLLSSAMTHNPVFIYWTMRSIVTCFGVINLEPKYMTSSTELSILADKLSNIQGQLQKQLALLYQRIDEMRQIETYNNLVRLFQTNHNDNMMILKCLLCPPDGLQSLIVGSTKERVDNMEVLSGKTVLLLISDLDISESDIMFLVQIYKDYRNQSNRVEMVWLPVVYKATLSLWTDVEQEKFEELMRLDMPWYSVRHTKMQNPGVMKYIKEVWRFEKKPILVVLDPQGKVVNPNALHMLRIWGSDAFPLTTLREQALWKDETWGLSFLLHGINSFIPADSIKEAKFICLYGGEDTGWIERFTTLLQNVAQVTSIPIEMVYIGKSDPNDNVRKIIASTTSNNLSRCPEDIMNVRLFWIRLESMWHSKVQLGKAKENDLILQEIQTILTLGEKNEGWAAMMISREIGAMTTLKGEIILKTLSQIDEWKENVERKGLIGALNEQLLQHRCKQIILSGIHEELMMCAECGRPMEKYFMYEF